MAEPAYDLYNPEEPEEPGSSLGSPKSASHRPNLKVLEGGQKADSPDELADKESTAGTAQHSTSSLSESRDDDTLGKGYTGGGGKKSSFLSKVPGSSKVKKWVLISGGTAAAGIIGGFVAFFALLPLKMVSIVGDLQSTFSAAAISSVDKESDNLFSGYASRILSSARNGSCNSTVSASCYVATSGSDPVSRLYQAWHQGHLEQKLADNYGIVLGAKGSNHTLYMNINGVSAASDSDLEKVRVGKESIFDMAGTVQLTKTEARQTIDKALEDSSLWDKVYFRFKYSSLLKNKYDIRLCVIACNFYDKFAAPATQKLKMAEAEVAMRVLAPLNANYAAIITCIISGGCPSGKDKEPTGEGTDGTEEELSPLQETIQNNIANLLGKDPEALDAVFGKAGDIMSNGWIKTMSQQLVDKVVSQFLGDEAGSAAGEAAVPVVGWALMIANIDNTLIHAGPALRMLSYAADVGAAISTWQTYNTVVSEMKSGHTDATELGSFSQSLDTNLSGSSSNQVDATQTPLYSSLYGGGSTNYNTPYTCSNGSKVTPPAVVCPEEQLDRGNNVADKVSSFANIPGLAQLGAVVGGMNNWPVIGGLVTGLVSGIAKMGMTVIGTACSWITQCSSLGNDIQGMMKSFAQWLTNSLIQSPFTAPDGSSNISGGRIFDMMAAGADASNNESCETELGCQQISNQQVAEIRNQQTEEEKTQFDSQPLFARLFSTTSPYSLVSRIAVAFPTTNPVTSFGQWFGDIVSDPFGKMATAFSDIFAADKAFAAVPAQSDPFGIPQYGYPTNDPVFTDNPQTYWDDYCKGDYMTKWLNSQTTDADGNSIASSPNNCLLINASVQSAGGMFNTSLIPQSDQNLADPPPSGQSQ